MERQLISSHKLLTDYSNKAKIRSIIIGWAVYLIIFGITRVPAVQKAMAEFAASVTVDWVTSFVNFLINGLWIFFVVLGIGTIVTLVKKQTFDTMNIYDTGIGFGDTRTGQEQYADYQNINLSYGKMKESFWVEAKPIQIKLSEYGFGEYDEPDLLREHLEAYGDWRAVKS